MLLKVRHEVVASDVVTSLIEQLINQGRSVRQELSPHDRQHEMRELETKLRQTESELSHIKALIDHQHRDDQVTTVIL